jgi:hypothetical protein
MHVRTIFSSSGIGIDSFKSTRDQHATRYAPSIGKYFNNFPFNRYFFFIIKMFSKNVFLIQSINQMLKSSPKIYVI